jgi:glycosyltransferase involved in cell wall biosynthesis
MASRSTSSRRIAERIGPVRVLLLLQNESLPSDRHVWNECLALVRAGHELTVVSPIGEDRDLIRHEVLEGVDIHRYVPRGGGDGIAAYAVEYAAALWSMRRLARRLAASGPFDVVHSCTPPDFMLLAALGLRRRGARFVFDHHDLTPELYLTRFGAGPVQRATLIAEQFAFRIADVVLSVNDSYRRVAIERGGLDPDDVFVVRTGPDLTQFAPTEPDPELKRGKRFLLSYVGVMGPQDGIDEALLSLAELRSIREDWHAMFMGDGPLLDRMRSMSSELGLSGCVEFTGWFEHDEIGRALSTSDVCLAPDPKNPLNDISSMVKISEYMAMSRPIVSFDLAESRFGAAAAAVFAAPGDHRGFATHISDLLDRPDRRAEMGAAGRARAEALLAWEHQERSLLSAYRRAQEMGPVEETRRETLLRIARPRARSREH